VVISQNIFDILAAAKRFPADEQLLWVLCDALEEEGFIPQRWTVLGRCQYCGGDMYLDDKSGHDPPYWSCKKCRNDDVDYHMSTELRLMRVIRELGCRLCQGRSHYYSKPTSSCPICGGAGIVRK
jgi:rubrerythrin